MFTRIILIQRILRCSATCKALLDNRTINHRTEDKGGARLGLDAIIHVSPSLGLAIQARIARPQEHRRIFVERGIDAASCRISASARALADLEVK